MKKHILFLMSFLFLLPISIIAQQKSIWDRIPEEVRKTNAFQRFEWHYKQIAFPYDTIPIQKYKLNKEKQRVSLSGLLLDQLVLKTPVGFLPTGAYQAAESEQLQFIQIIL